MIRLTSSKLLSILLIACSAGAPAACLAPSAVASLGSASSFAINTTVSSSSGTVNLNCGSGSIVSLLPGDYIRLSLAGASSTNGSRAALKLNNGSDSIAVKLCSTQNCATELLAGGSSVTYNSSQLANLLGTMGGLNFAIPLYLQTLTGQNVAAGTYTATLNVMVNYSICTGLGIAGLCLSGSQQTGSAIEPMTVTLNVTNDCIAIVAPNISFGSAPLVTLFAPVSQSIVINCTKDSTYSVGLSNGNHAVNNTRNMANGSAMLSYELYKSTSINRWGSVGSERWSSVLSSAISSDGTFRTYQYVAKILPNQATPPVGNYSDNIVVDLTY